MKEARKEERREGITKKWSKWKDQKQWKGEEKEREKVYEGRKKGTDLKSEEEDEREESKREY